MNFDDELDLPISLSKKSHDFLRCCLAKKPEQRKNARQLLQHPFITTVDEVKCASFTNEVSKLRVLSKNENKSSRRKTDQGYINSKTRDQATVEDRVALLKIKSQQQFKN